MIDAHVHNMRMDIQQCMLSTPDIHVSKIKALFKTNKLQDENITLHNYVKLDRNLKWMLNIIHIAISAENLLASLKRPGKGQREITNSFKLVYSSILENNDFKSKLVFAVDFIYNFLPCKKKSVGRK